MFGMQLDYPTSKIRGSDLSVRRVNLHECVLILNPDYEAVNGPFFKLWKLGKQQTCMNLV